MRYKNGFSIEFKLNNTLAYLCGVIIGDGYLRNGTKSKTNLFKNYEIKIEIVEKEYANFLMKHFKTIVKTKSKIKKIVDKRPNRKIRYSVDIKNKWLYNFFTNTMDIPSGKKSGKVFIPKKILKNKNYSRWFIAGLYDTDGGKRGHTIGFTTKSKRLNIQTSKILYEFKISHFTERWKNKKYNKEYYGIRLHKHSIDTFLNTFPLQNINKRGSARVWKMD